MRLPRASGVLLHPTSLPGRYGIGDIGPQAHAFVEFLADAGQRWWQMLPLGPTGFGNSPYQSYSSFAGNPLLISPEMLVDEGWLIAADLRDYPKFPDDHVEFDAVAVAKNELLRKAFERFKPKQRAFEVFQTENAHWLHDYALFMALKEANGGSAWNTWDPELVARAPEALAKRSKELKAQILYFKFIQFAFARQWAALREKCRSRDLSLIGDVPIFVALDSADVWARPELFQLDNTGRPIFVAGVPPDYFSATGQLWGNPVYRWESHMAEHFAWWIARMTAVTSRVDLVRLDHFRGFAAYWEVPASAPTAATGRWAPAPGAAFLDALRKGLGGLPIIAEDLGEITPDVELLRDEFTLPGMRVIQFGFGGDWGGDLHLPFRYVNHCVAYTGTHDNDTMIGWFRAKPRGDAAAQKHAKAERAYALHFIGSDGSDMSWDAIRVVAASVADTVVFPLQDVLGLDNSARMNVPGQAKGNWGWRFLASQLTPKVQAQLADVTSTYRRWNGPVPDRHHTHKKPASRKTSPKRSATGGR